MDKTRTESSYSSLAVRYGDEIEVCSCAEDEYSPTRSGLLGSASNIENSTMESPIVLFRKDMNKCRIASSRCPHQRRVLQKNGASHVIRSNVPLRYARYLRDFGNTMVNSRWRWITVSLMLSFFILWLLFAWFWMLISVAHGDMDENPRNDTCSVGIKGFAGFLLMSIETQTTIGYGSRYPTENCPEGVFMICLQMILGIGVQGAILGMVYVKMTRPATRDSQRLFSRVAVVCQRDGELCLLFRICDKRRSHIVGTKIRAYLMECRVTSQGEVVPSYQKPLVLESVGLLLWPLIVVHRIGVDSPLYDVSAKDLLTKRFEIIVIMLGCSDSTGQMTQSRTSYLSTEIKWGHRFKACTGYDYGSRSYVVQKELFNATEVVDTPLCSAHRLHQVVGVVRENSMPSTPSTAVEEEVWSTTGLNLKDISETFV